MECKKIREWLLTDYGDGELGPAESAEVRKHVESCTACRDFMREVERRVKTPFRGLKIMEPDLAVWLKIRGVLERESGRSDAWRRTIDRWVQPWLKPLPVLRVAFVAAVVFTVAALAKWPLSPVEPAYAYVEEQMTFLGDLGTGDPAVVNGDTGFYELPEAENAG
ncbi:MAG: zf-HC2 domain-containing protein [Candidatus Omnitrophica bacterium]|nr:zf-HC2 domain-containing protein [Candidatus Omnitrophota bacterium]